MKTLLKWYSVLFLTVLAAQVWAATNLPVPVGTNTPPATGTPAPLPVNTSDFWQLAIGAFTPFIVAGVRKFVPSIPAALLPAITPVIGIVLGLILNALAQTNLGFVDMAKAGALAVFFREVVNQTITKRLEAPATPPAGGA